MKNVVNRKSAVSLLQLWLCATVLVVLFTNGLVTLAIVATILIILLVVHQMLAAQNICGVPADGGSLSADNRSMNKDGTDNGAYIENLFCSRPEQMQIQALDQESALLAKIVSELASLEDQFSTVTQTPCLYSTSILKCNDNFGFDQPGGIN